MNVLVTCMQFVRVICNKDSAQVLYVTLSQLQKEKMCRKSKDFICEILRALALAMLIKFFSFTDLLKITKLHQYPHLRSGA